MRRIVVVGTGTGVGKTTVSVALLRALRCAQPDVQALGVKLIETGLVDGLGSDAQALEEASTRGLPMPKPHPMFGFGEPLSPHLAARRAGHPALTVPGVLIRFETWLKRLRAQVAIAASESSDGCGLPLDQHQPPPPLDQHQLPPPLETGHVGRPAKSEPELTGRGREKRATPAASGPWIVIETAGALLSPLAAGVTNFDLARALDPALWILAAADSLGTLHDVSACLEILRHRGRAPDHVILSAARVDASTGTNADEMRLLGIANPSAVLDRDGRGLDAFAEALVRDADA